MRQKSRYWPGLVLFASLRRIHTWPFPISRGLPLSLAPHPLQNGITPTSVSAISPSLTLTLLLVSFTYKDPSNNMDSQGYLEWSPHFKICNLITSAKTLLPCKATWSQLFGLGCGHLWGVIILPPTEAFPFRHFFVHIIWQSSNIC
jgi:hypothetical protein